MSQKFDRVSSPFLGLNLKVTAKLTRDLATWGQESDPILSCIPGNDFISDGEASLGPFEIKSLQLSVKIL